MAPTTFPSWWFIILLFAVPILVIAGVIYFVAGLVSRDFLNKKLSKKWFFVALVPSAIITLFLLNFL